MAPYRASSAAPNSGTISLTQHRHRPRVTVHPYAGAVGDLHGGIAGADDARDAVLPRHDRRVRERTTAVGDDRAQQRQQDVEGFGGRLGEQDVALLDTVEVGRTSDAPHDPFPHARAGPRPRITWSSCASSETGRTSRSSRRPIAAMSRAIGGGSAEGSGGGIGLVAQMRRGVLRGVGLVVGRGGPPGRRRSASTILRAARTSRRCPRRRSARRRGDATLGKSTARGHGGTTHQPGRPDVSVDTALVAHRVADARLLQQGVVVLAMLPRNVAADLSDLRSRSDLRVRRCRSRS